MDEIEEIEKRLTEWLDRTPDKHVALIVKRDVQRLLEIARKAT